jgi:TP53 regulating kinase-like protein
MTLIAQGAEGKLFRRGDLLVKRRVSKGYRVKELDCELRRSRTRKEGKLLEKLSGLGIAAPGLVSVSDKSMEIKMEYIDGKRLSQHLSSRNMASICPKIGEAVARLHQNNIIHGDVTTSNMILKGDVLYLIDFGLSFHSTKIEDRAVELHVLKQALQSKHHQIWEKGFKLVEKAYRKHCKQAGDVLNRLEQVESRGRYKH